jgi:hypothetical protein
MSTESQNCAVTETAFARLRLHNMQQWNNWEAVFSMDPTPIEELLGDMLSMQSMPKLHKELTVHCELVWQLEAS